MVDPGANFPIMSQDISKRSKLEIDTKEKYDLRNIATTPTESLVIVRNVPVNFASGCTIYADFAIVKYPKLMLILLNTLLDKYIYDLLASKQKLRLECNGKEFFIPINMHKVKNKLEVNCVNINPECDASSTSDRILQDLQDLSENDNVLKKVSYESMATRMEELEKALFTSVQSNLETMGHYNNLCEWYGQY